MFYSILISSAGVLTRPPTRHGLRGGHGPLAPLYPPLAKPCVVAVLRDRLFVVYDCIRIHVLYACKGWPDVL